MDTRPVKVIVGMPVFNGEEFIEAAIESILSQSHQNLELLISDNASTDRTESICRAFQAVDSRVNYFRQKENIGVLKNYQFLLKKAADSYFMWACADDVWSKDWISLLLPNSMRGNIFSFGRYILIDEIANPIVDLGQKLPIQFAGGRYFRRIKFFLTPGIFGKGNVMYSIFHTRVFDSEWITRDSVTKYGGDTALMYQILKFYELKITPGAVMYKRLHTKNVGGIEFPGQKANYPWIVKFLRMIVLQPLAGLYWPESNFFEKLMLITFYPIAVLAIFLSSIFNRFIRKSNG